MCLNGRQSLLLMVHLTFTCNAITCMCLITFEVPCESNTQSVEHKRLKIGMHLEISEKIKFKIQRGVDYYLLGNLYM